MGNILKKPEAAEILARNLSMLIEIYQISESDLARALGLPYNTIKRLMQGTTKDPRTSTLQLIAAYFCISLDALLSVSVSHAIFQQQIPRNVPIVNWHNLSQPNFLLEMNKKAWMNWQPVILSDTQNFSEETYAIKTTPSMQPRYPNGTMLIVDPEEKPIDGDVVLVRMLNDNAVSLRDLVIDPPNWQLLPIIPNSSVLFFCKEKHQIIGVVIL